MEHSYLKSHASFPVATKGSNGELTSEGIHMENLEHLSHKVNWRHPDSVLSKSAEEKAELKRRKAALKG